MPTVLTMIAGAGGRRDLPGLAAALARDLSAGIDWLAPDEACDLLLDAENSAAAEARARAAIADAPIDLVIQPVATRRKRLLVADLESTIIGNEMLDEIGELLGVRARVSEITRRAMNGEIDFVAALAERLELLAGVEAEVLERAYARVRITRGAHELVARMRRDGAMTALVSGGFTIFAERIAERLGFDRVVSNRLEIVAGRITGRIAAPIVTGETKRQTLIELTAEYAIPVSRTLAVGDGANDLPMLAAAGLGVAFHGKPSVAAAAPARIDHADLTALLYLQGYHRKELAD